MRRVAITGLGMVSAIGSSVNDSWKRALLADSGVRTIQSFDASKLPCQIAAEVDNIPLGSLIEAKEASRLSRFILMALAAAKEALDDAALIDWHNKERFGCSIGVGIGSIEDVFKTSLVIKDKGSKWVSPFFIPYVIPNMAAGLVSQRFGLKGPNLCIATACTSGTHAIGEAWMHIRSGMADMMLCGGTESTICEIAVSGFANMKALSRRNDNPKASSRPFDKDRDGFVMGEGSGLLVLEDMEHAKKRGAKIYAELTGYGMSGDAFHITSPAPEAEGAQRSMKMALQQAGLNPEDIDYINAHGTSTQANDEGETHAIASVFSNHHKKLAISSTKGVTGHCLGAAGGIEAVFLAKAIATQIAPPTANLDQPDEKCFLDYIPKEARQMLIRAGMSNSFGFGGTNGVLVMTRHV